MSNDYTIDCTGDACVGDQVRFDRDLFTGSFRKPKFAGTQTVEGIIVKESYGADKQQHTFTIERADGTTVRIKGRNLYRNGTWRRAWPDEAERERVLGEKHARGDRARAERDRRRFEANPWEVMS